MPCCFSFSYSAQPTWFRMITKPVELSPPHALEIAELTQLCNVFKCNCYLFSRILLIVFSYFMNSHTG